MEINEFEEINNGDDADRAWDDLRQPDSRQPENPAVYRITYRNKQSGEQATITATGFPECQQLIEAEWRLVPKEFIEIVSWEGVA